MVTYRPVTEALRDLAYILDRLQALRAIGEENLKMGIFITNEVTRETPAVVHFYPKGEEQARALVQAVNAAAEQRLTWEEDLLSAPALVLPFGNYLELSMEVTPVQQGEGRNQPEGGPLQEETGEVSPPVEANLREQAAEGGVTGLLPVSVLFFLPGYNVSTGEPQ